MRDRFMPLPSSDNKHAHVLWITWAESYTIRTCASGIENKEPNGSYGSAGAIRSRNSRSKAAKTPAQQGPRRQTTT